MKKKRMSLMDYLNGRPNGTNDYWKAFRYILGTIVFIIGVIAFSPIFLVKILWLWKKGELDFRDVELEL